MEEKSFKHSIYIILAILIIIFYTKEIDLSSIFYKNIKKIKNPDDISVLVNKNNKLNAYYIPDDLEKINLMYATEDKYMRKSAKEAFELLSSDAKKLGYKIIAVSTYRNFEYQDRLFNYYVETKGKEYALECSARPGHSEHQTGLAVDVMGSNNDYDEFESSKEFNWMANNCYKYGFILRYPKGKEHITGFKYEPWHYRYVGKDIAEYIYKNNLTLEEYHKK